MKKIKYWFIQAYLRLFKGETPLFFKYWGTIMAILTAYAVFLNAKIAMGTAPEEYQKPIFIFDCVVGFLHVVTPFLANKDQNITKDDPVEAVKTYKQAHK